VNPALFLWFRARFTFPNGSPSSSIWNDLAPAPSLPQTEDTQLWPWSRTPARAVARCWPRTWHRLLPAASERPRGGPRERVAARARFIDEWVVAQCQRIQLRCENTRSTRYRREVSRSLMLVRNDGDSHEEDLHSFSAAGLRSRRVRCLSECELQGGRGEHHVWPNAVAKLKPILTAQGTPVQRSEAYPGGGDAS
jgi:hypothetical protein